MAEDSNPQSQHPAPSAPPEYRKLGVGPGIAIGCAVNLALLVIVPITLIKISGGIWTGNGKVTVPEFLAVFLGANAVAIALAARRKQKGLIIGFVIAAALALLLSSPCWSSF